MSRQTFAELQSTDPVERAIAQRVVEILNTPGLARPERERRVRQAQRELLDHRARQQRRAAMQAQAARLPLPAGYERTSVRMAGDRVAVGGLCRRRGFAWFDAGRLEAGSPSLSDGARR